MNKIFKLIIIPLVLFGSSPGWGEDHQKKQDRKIKTLEDKVKKLEAELLELRTLVYQKFNLEFPSKTAFFKKDQSCEDRLLELDEQLKKFDEGGYKAKHPYVKALIKQKSELNKECPS